MHEPSTRTQDAAVEQVRAILNRMDEQVDSARRRRLGGVEQAPPPLPAQPSPQARPAAPTNGQHASPPAPARDDLNALRGRRAQARRRLPPDRSA